MNVNAGGAGKGADGGVDVEGVDCVSVSRPAWVEGDGGLQRSPRLSVESRVAQMGCISAFSEIVRAGTLDEYRELAIMKMVRIGRGHLRT